MAKIKSPIAKGMAKGPARPNRRLTSKQKPIAMVKAKRKDTRKRERPNRQRPKREMGLELDKRPHSSCRPRKREQLTKPVQDEPKDSAAKVTDQNGAKPVEAGPMDAEEERRANPALEEAKEPEGAKPVETGGGLPALRVPAPALSWLPLSWAPTVGMHYP